MNKGGPFKNSLGDMFYPVKGQSYYFITRFGNKQMEGKFIRYYEDCCIFKVKGYSGEWLGFPKLESVK